MKLLLSSLLVISFFCIFSCTKNNNVKTTAYDTTTIVINDTVWERTPRNPIVGFWAGTFKYAGNTTDSFYYSFNIDSNGVMYTTDIDANASSGSTGPWQLNGTSFTATLTGMNGATPEIVQSVTATYDSVAGTLSGTNVFIQGMGTTTTFYLLRTP